MSVLCYLIQKTVAGEVLVEVYADYSSRAAFKSKDTVFEGVPVITVNAEGKQFALEYRGNTFVLPGGLPKVSCSPSGREGWITCSEELRKALSALLPPPIKRIVVIRPGNVSVVWDIDSLCGPIAHTVMASVNSAKAMREAELTDEDAVAIVSEMIGGGYLIDVSFCDKCVTGSVRVEKGKYLWSNGTAEHDTVVGPIIEMIQWRMAQ